MGVNYTTPPTPLEHPTEPLKYADAITYVEEWLNRTQLDDEARSKGFAYHIYDYYDRNPKKRKERKWVGVRVSELDCSNKSAGGSYMQVDLPWGIAFCGQVERCIIALIENWNRTAVWHEEDFGGEHHAYWQYADTEEEFWRLTELFKEANKENS